MVPLGAMAATSEVILQFSGWTYPMYCIHWFILAEDKNHTLRLHPPFAAPFLGYPILKQNMTVYHMHRCGRWGFLGISYLRAVLTKTEPRKGCRFSQLLRTVGNLGFVTGSGVVFLLPFFLAGIRFRSIRILWSPNLYRTCINQSTWWDSLASGSLSSIAASYVFQTLAISPPTCRSQCSLWLLWTVFLVIGGFKHGFSFPLWDVIPTPLTKLHHGFQDGHSQHHQAVGSRQPSFIPCSI